MLETTHWRFCCRFVFFPFVVAPTSSPSSRCSTSHLPILPVSFTVHCHTRSTGKSRQTTAKVDRDREQAGQHDSKRFNSTAAQVSRLPHLRSSPCRVYCSGRRSDPFSLVLAQYTDPHCWMHTASASSLPTSTESATPSRSSSSTSLTPATGSLASSTMQPSSYSMSLSSH